MLTNEVMSDISIALKKVTKLTAQTEYILLGSIPVLDEDGLEELGTLECGANWEWYFEPAPGRDAEEAALRPTPDAPRLRAVEDPGTRPSATPYPTMPDFRAVEHGKKGAVIA